MGLYIPPSTLNVKSILSSKILLWANLSVTPVRSLLVSNVAKLDPGKTASVHNKSILSEIADDVFIHFAHHSGQNPPPFSPKFAPPGQGILTSK